MSAVPAGAVVLDCVSVVAVGVSAAVVSVFAVVSVSVDAEGVLVVVGFLVLA